MNELVLFLLTNGIFSPIWNHLKNPDTAAAIQAICFIITVFISLMAIILSYRSVKFQNRVQKGSITPILGIHIVNTKYQFQILLCNHGLGPAKIIKIVFRKDDIEIEGRDIGILDLLTNEIRTFFDVKIGETRFNTITYIKSNDLIPIIDIDASVLTSGGLHLQETVYFIEIKNVLQKISVTIDYEDILGIQKQKLDESFDIIK